MGHCSGYSATSRNYIGSTAWDPRHRTGYDSCGFGTHGGQHSEHFNDTFWSTCNTWASNINSYAGNGILVSRDADPMLFALWFTALAMTPPMIVAVPKIVQFYFLQRAPAALVLQIATAERSFFVLYGMLATALLAALTWDALFPDRKDQEIVGALPVRPRTLAGARLAAALTVGTVFAAAILICRDRGCSR